jgi:hypothetical protein
MADPHVRPARRRRRAPTRPAADLVQQRGPSGGPGALPHLAQQAGAFEVGERQRHRRLGQAGGLRQFGPGRLAEPEHLGEDGRGVHHA